MKTNIEKKVTLLYLIIGITWIILSDKILLLLISNTEIYHVLQTYKGWFYVFITAIIFYLILHKTMNKLRKQSIELKDSYAQLEADNEEFIALNEEIILTNRKLSEQKERLRKIVDLVPQLIFAKDGRGRFLLANQAVAELYKQKPADIIGKTHNELHGNISPEELGHFLSSDKKVLETNEAITLEEESITDLKGETRIYRTRKIPFTFSDTINKAILGVAVDITELKKGEKIIRDYHLKEEKFREEIILSLTDMLEIYDPYTQGHSQNVANLARKIAEEMALSREETEHAYWTGIVHDIGKILVPINILNKRNKLTDGEFTVIKKHPEWGYKTLGRSGRLTNIAKYVLYHHERWDGKGYPTGISREDIPIIAQIVAIADTWDAMCSDRPYRKAMAVEDAVEEIKKNRGKQFAPEVVDTFLNIVEDLH